MPSGLLHHWKQEAMFSRFFPTADVGNRQQYHREICRKQMEYQFKFPLLHVVLVSMETKCEISPFQFEFVTFKMHHRKILKNLLQTIV